MLWSEVWEGAQWIAGTGLVICMLLVGAMAVCFVAAIAIPFIKNTIKQLLP